MNKLPKNVVEKIKNIEIPNFGPKTSFAGIGNGGGGGLDALKDAYQFMKENGEKVFGKGTKKAKGLRKQYVGRTPGKRSQTGREVIERMKNENPPRIRTTRRGITEFKASDGEWYELSQADMAHRTDAVSWWNSVGRHYGAKSKEVRKWMLDSDNYELDHYSLNRSAGAKLGERYLPPTKK
ncbi:hypothetical protein ACQVTT_22700 [Bacillus mycoides]|uniref:hypothetical protein n=1 Tax=Bacillus mycoides TaxID=1405 RepID=UPI003D651C54